ncbi:uncharacterized protein LOC144141560 isoform X1 [Haemaphysalis longicornis]
MRPLRSDAPSPPLEEPVRVAYLYPEAVEAALADFVEAVGRRLFEAIRAAFAEMTNGVPSRHDVNQQQFPVSWEEVGGPGSPAECGHPDRTLLRQRTRSPRLR